MLEPAGTAAFLPNHRIGGFKTPLGRAVLDRSGVVRANNSTEGPQLNLSPLFESKLAKPTIQSVINQLYMLQNRPKAAIEYYEVALRAAP